MADGSRRPIEKVQVGDFVLAYDFRTHAITYAPVTHVFVHPVHEASRPLVRINGNLRATTNHPFFANGKWVRAENLNVGDSLITIGSPDPLGDASTAATTIVSSLTLEDERETTFNIEVEGVHDYFAGGVLVHNKTPCPPSR